MQDDRLNLPSASAAEADSRCPGRHLLHSTFPSEESEYSKHGTLIHAAMKGEKVELSPEQTDWIRIAKHIDARVSEHWVDDFDDEFHEMREKRLWAHDANGNKTNSGQADMFVIHGPRALLADYKSLFGDVDAVETNLQLRDLAVLIHLNYGVTEVTAYINQPRVTRNPKLVVYSYEDLGHAMRDMTARVKASMDPNSPRIPGESQCKFCNGKLVCEEYKAAAMAPLTAMTMNDEAAMKPKVIKPMLENRVAVMASDKLVELRDMLKLTDMLKDATDAEIRKRLAQDASSVPGMTLEPGRKVRSVKSVLGAWECFTDILTPDQFNECCDIGIGKLEEAYRNAKGCTHDEAKEQVNHRLNDVLEWKQQQEMLRRVK